MGTIGWYGPLINLSEAPSHIGHYVQLLVFLHKSTPVQYKVSKGTGRVGEVIRMDIQVGDETRSYFPVTIWQKLMHSTVVAGEIILLQNVKVLRFKDVVEARTLHCSSLVRLVHLHEMPKGVDDLIGDRCVGITTKDKLQRVIGWVRRAGLIHCTNDLNRARRQLLVNWKAHGETQAKDCSSLIEIHHLPDSCEAIFCASVGEMFLPVTWRSVKDSASEEMFISRRLEMLEDNNFVDDFISSGCELCGVPLNSEYRVNIKQNTFPLHCQKSSNRLHMVGMIYRPFMLYVWDDSKYIPLLVRNKAAELLFGNISAEKVYSCYRRQKQIRNADPKVNDVANHCSETTTLILNASDNVGLKGKDHHGRNPNFFLIWLVLLRILLLQGKNDPLKFKIMINSGKDIECGRYEMVSVLMPMFGTSSSFV